MEITPYGAVSSDETGTEVYGAFVHLYAWATRPDASWPCSVLARQDEVTARFDARGDLVDLVATNYTRDELDEIPADELNAWTSDVLRAAGMTEHPAIR